MQIQKPADLARIVKTQRQAQGFTQQEVAESVGITRQSLARIESGHAGASFDLVLRILDELNIHLEANSYRQPIANVSIPARDTDALWKETSAAIADALKVGTSAIVAAATAAKQSDELAEQNRKASASTCKKSLREASDRGING